TRGWARWRHGNERVASAGGAGAVRGVDHQLQHRNQTDGIAAAVRAGQLRRYGGRRVHAQLDSLGNGWQKDRGISRASGLPSDDSVHRVITDGSGAAEVLAAPVRKTW